jgi:hypothetical protein
VRRPDASKKMCLYDDDSDDEDRSGSFGRVLATATGLDRRLLEVLRILIAYYSTDAVTLI